MTVERSEYFRNRIEQLEEQLDLRDKAIALLDQQVLVSQRIIALKNAQLSEYREMIEKAIGARKDKP